MNPGKGAQGDLGVPGLGMKCPTGLGDNEGFPGQRSRVKARGGLRLGLWWGWSSLRKVFEMEQVVRDRKTGTTWGKGSAHGGGDLVVWGSLGGSHGVGMKKDLKQVRPPRNGEGSRPTWYGVLGSGIGVFGKSWAE